MEQWYANVPAVAKVKLNVPLCAAIGFAIPESKDFPSSLVTVCATAVVFFHVTVVPALTVKVAGLKAKEPLLSVMIMTDWALPACVAVAVGVLVVGVVPVFVELPPQAARSTSVLSATRQNKTGLSCFLAVEIPKVIDLFKSIFFSSFFPLPPMGKGEMWESAVASPRCAGPTPRQGAAAP